MKQFELKATNIETGVEETVFFDAKHLDFHDLTKALERDEMEFDVIETLKKYININVIENFETEILNDNDIWLTPFNELVEDGKLYDILNENYPLEEHNFDLSTISQMKILHSSQADDKIYDDGLRRVWVSRVDENLVTFERMILNEYGSVTWEETKTFYAE